MSRDKTERREKYAPDWEDEKEFVTITPPPKKAKQAAEPKTEED